MESLLFAINAVLPIVIIVVIGYMLKRTGFVTQEFGKMANKMVFRLFLPAMLFLNIYKIEKISLISFDYVYYAIITVILTFIVNIPLTRFITKDGARRGALLQGTFRSNFALVGIPLAMSLYGEEGGAIASVLSAILIPTFNILAVISLSLFNEEKTKDRGVIDKIKNLLLSIVKNPLIISVALGCLTLAVRMLFVKWGVEFRLSDIAPIYKVLSYLSNVATPLALIALGIQFEFSAIKELRREIIFGVAVKNFAAPVLWIGLAVIFRNYFSGAHFAAFVATFATPVAVSSIPMAQEMKANSDLAGQLVVWTTVMSGLVIFVITYLLKLIGIF